MIFGDENYEIQEEVPFETVTNNIGEEIWPPYRADMLLTKQFIIELDSKKLHGTHRKIVHDRWRDSNVKEQVNLKTVRLLSSDVNQQSPEEILEEVEWKLRQYPRDDGDMPTTSINDRFPHHEQRRNSSSGRPRRPRRPPGRPTVGHNNNNSP
jgi:hypothetical protein